MLRENAGGFIEFRRWGADDQQIKCCSSPPRQDLIKPHFCHISQKPAFAGLACITDVSTTLGGIWHLIKAENVTQSKEGDREKELHKLCQGISGGQDKSKVWPHQSKIPHKSILGHANGGAVTGRCQAGNDVTLLCTCVVTRLLLRQLRATATKV